MRSKLRRIGALVGRYRVDRRLPPPVYELYRTVVASRLRDRFDDSVARLRPVVGNGSPLVRIDRRRVAVAGELRHSIDELQLAAAVRVERVLLDAGVGSFVADRDNGRVQIGIPVENRHDALLAISRGLDEPWVVRWHDGRRSGLKAIGAARRSRRVRQARCWELFQPFQMGINAAGPSAAVVVTFWELGTSDQLELVGTRGHERFHPASPETVETISGRPFRGRAAFPVERSLERFGDPIDVVFTWVDGADPVWAEQFRATAASHGRSVDEAALDPARYRSRDELRYALRSVWAYCGWVNRIWIVTAGQRPEWLATGFDDRITVVDHSEILPGDCLPTFNSHAIESALHRIDGLAEHFIYFNDDMFIRRPVQPELFFTPNGLAKVFQSRARVHAHEHPDSLAVDTAAIRGRELLLERFGRTVSGKPYHAPYPLRRSTLDAMAAEFPDIVQRTASSRFRSPSDLSIAASFGQHYGLATAQSVLGDIAAEYVHVESARLRWHLDRIRLGDDIDTYCINETSDGTGLRDRRELIDAFFQACVPVAAPWERRG